MPEETIGSLLVSEQPQVRPEGNEGAWSSILQNLKNDPASRVAMLNMGIRLTQPRRPGQSSLGQFTEAVGGAVDQYAQVGRDDAVRKKEQAKAELAQKRQALEARKADSTIDLQQAQTKRQGELTGLDQQRIDAIRAATIAKSRAEGTSFNQHIWDTAEKAVIEREARFGLLEDKPVDWDTAAEVNKLYRTMIAGEKVTQPQAEAAEATASAAAFKRAQENPLSFEQLRAAFIAAGKPAPNHDFYINDYLSGRLQLPPERVLELTTTEAGVRPATADAFNLREN